MAGYVLAIKESARRRNVVAAEWVQTQGTQRTFHSKAAAKQWATRVSSPGGIVWVQDVAPNDPAPVDGYLVGGRRGRTVHDDGSAQTTLGERAGEDGGAEEEI